MVRAVPSSRMVSDFETVCRAVTVTSSTSSITWPSAACASMAVKRPSASLVVPSVSYRYASGFSGAATLNMPLSRSLVSVG